MSECRSDNQHWDTGEDMTGKTSGWLTVIERVPRPEEASVKARGTWWKCRCRCGNEKIVLRQYITQKNVTSCGCKANKTGQFSREKVRQSDTMEYPKKRRRNAPGLATSLETIATECKCPACGKTFERMSREWAYKAYHNGKLRWYCSWKCLRTEKTQRISQHATEA